MRLMSVISTPAAPDACGFDTVKHKRHLQCSLMIVLSITLA